MEQEQEQQKRQKVDADLPNKSIFSNEVAQLAWYIEKIATFRIRKILVLRA